MNVLRRLRRSISERHLPSRPKLTRTKSNASITQQEESEQTEHGDIVFLGPIHETALRRPSPPLSFCSLTASDSSSDEDIFQEHRHRKPKEKRPSSVSFAAIEKFNAAMPPRRRASYTGPPKPKPAIKAKPRYSCTSLQLQSAQAKLMWTQDICDQYNNIMGEFDDIVIGGVGWD